MAVLGCALRAKKTWSCVEIFAKHAERRAPQLLADGPKGITRLRQVPPQRSRSPDIDGSRVGRLPCLVPAILFARTTSLSLGKVTLSMSIRPTSRPATFSTPRRAQPPEASSSPGCVERLLASMSRGCSWTTSLCLWKAKASEKGGSLDPGMDIAPCENDRTLARRSVEKVLDRNW